MSARKIKDDCLDTLQKAVVAQMSLEWDLAVEKLPMHQQVEAALLLARTQSKRVRLENAELKDIAKRLKRNEKALANGAKRVKSTLSNLKKVAAVVSAVNSFLGILTRIV